MMLEKSYNQEKSRTLRNHEIYHISEVKAAIKTAVEFYNHERPHWSLEGMTPSQAAQGQGELKKKWKSYWEMAIKREAAVGMIV